MSNLCLSELLNNAAANPSHVPAIRHAYTNGICTTVISEYITNALLLLRLALRGRSDRGQGRNFVSIIYLNQTSKQNETLCLRLSWVSWVPAVIAYNSQFKKTTKRVAMGTVGFYHQR
jgi:hypothetical protein